MKAKLLPKSKRLKELIKLKGEVWEFLVCNKSVQCFNDKGWYIQSFDGTHKRWVKEDEFEVVK